MWQRVEAVVDDLLPLIESVGIRAAVVDVLDQVVTVELSRTDASARPDLARLRDFIAREIQAEVPEVSKVEFEGDLAAPPPAPAPSGPRVTYEPPAAEADTVVLTVDRAVAPEATSVFDEASTADGWPVVRAVLAVDGVVSVIGRGSRLIVARRDDAGWDVVLPAVEAAIAGAELPVDPDSIRERVEALLDREVNPSIASHGGYIELREVHGTELVIFMGGGCQGCAMSQATLRQGVEKAIRDAVPEVTAIHDATDHASGQNPYFR